MSGEHEPPPAENPDPAENSDPAEAVADPAEVAARRRRLAEVFGDVLPDVTGDDAPDTVTRDDRPADPAERWYSENRPPHHDNG